MSITNITITSARDEFAQSSNCPISPSTLAAGANCTISVTFKPTDNYGSIATLTITDNAAGSPHTLPLSGTGTADFTISVSPSTATISSGQSTTYTLTITPLGVTGMALSCTGAPSAASCSLPASVALNGTDATNATATVTTTARSIMTPTPGPWIVPLRIHLPFSWPGLLLLLALATLARLAAGRVDPRRGYASSGALMVLILLFGCGGNGGSRSAGIPGTPAGTYTITFTGTAEGVTHSTSVTLTVK